jgi:hypothetical protein
VSQYYNPNGAWASPTYWINCNGPLATNGYGDPNNPPKDYPIDLRTGSPTYGQSLYLAAIQVKPSIKECNPKLLQANTSGGMQVLLMDGSVRTINGTISVNTLARALVPNDGLVLGNDW